MPDPWIILNGQRLAAADATISPLGDGFMFGLGLFETINVRGGRMPFFPSHVERLQRGAAELGLPPPTSADALRARCEECIGANHRSEGALKLVWFQDATAVGELIVTRETPYSAEHYARGFRLKTVRTRGRPDRFGSLKTLNYLPCLTARRAAQAAGYDEALFVDAAGRALEGSASNVFVVKDRRVFTPRLDQAILPGVARAHVLRLLGRENVSEDLVPASLLGTADEVFVTNALLGVMPVAQVDDHAYDVNANPVTKAAMAAYRALEARSGSAGTGE